MNQGVKLVLQRMKNKPEEFTFNPYARKSKWRKLIDADRKEAISEEFPGLTNREYNKLYAAFRKIKQDAFTTYAVAAMTSDDDEEIVPQAGFIKNAVDGDIVVVQDHKGQMRTVSINGLAKGK